MPDHDNDIADLLRYLDTGHTQTSPLTRPRFHAALTALVAERNELRSKVNAHAEDRRQYIEAWAQWIQFNSALGIEAWLRVYADAIPAQPLDGDEAKNRIFDHLDQRMRDAADMIAALRERVAELEAKPADRDLCERDETLMRWMMKATTMLCDAESSPSHVRCYDLVNYCDAAIAAMRKGESDGK